MVDNQPSGSPVLQLLDRLLQAGPHDMAFLKADARALKDDLLRLSNPEHSRPQDSAVPRSAYDAWVVELFRATETAVPREALLRDFARRFAQVHAVGAGGDGRGARILVLHYLASHGNTPAQVTGFFQQGLAPDHWRRFQEQLSRQQDDPALQRLFNKRSRFERDYLPYMLQGGHYRSVFDTALGKAKGALREDFFAYGPNAWITAQPLFGDDNREGHAVVMLYPNEGRYFEYREPAKGAQDLRLLDVLAAVYRQLDNQIKNLAVQVMRAREQLLSRLGPAVLHHEVGGLARQVLESLEEMIEDWQRFERDYDPPPAVASLGVRLGQAEGWTNKLITTTSAFMNLERRGSVAPFVVADLLGQVASMVVVRCGAIGAQLQIDSVLQAPDETQTPREMRNDATLIMHALLNLVNNALDAMETRYLQWQDEVEAARKQQLSLPPPHASVIEVRWARRSLPVGCVGWEVVNTGPPIAAAARPRIFERGFTTRSQGHGQGLHLVRMTAQYCGGDVELMADTELDRSRGEAVGFLYWVARQHQVTRELSL